MLCVHNLSYSAANGHALLRNINFTLAGGQVLGLVGNNGAGKTTLLRLLAGVLTPTAGEIYLQADPVDGYAPQARAFDSYTPQARARLIAYRPQHMEVAWNLPVQDIVGLGVSAHATQAAIMQAMEACDLLALATRPIWQLSGGELARVYLAHTLARQARLVLADEPFAGLDMQYQLRLGARLRQYAQAPRAVIIAIHDIALALRVCTDFLILHNGEALGCLSANDPALLDMVGRALNVRLTPQGKGCATSLLVEEILP